MKFPIPFLFLSLVCAPSGLRSEPAVVFEQIAHEATPDEFYAFCFALPKGGDLHHHFGGSVPMEYVVDFYRNPERNGGRDFYLRTRIELCEKAGDESDAAPCVRPRVLLHCVDAFQWAAMSPCCQQQYKKVADLTPFEVESWLSGLKLDETGEGRDEFFEKTWWRLGPIFADIDLAPDLLVENMKAFAAEGIRYMEIQVVPRLARDASGNPVPMEEWYRVFKERLAQADAVATGVTVRFQIVVIRFLPDAEDHVREAFAFIDQHRDLFVGINMAGREDNGKGQARRFTDVFREMQRKYPKIPLAIHAGEADEPNSNIRDTLLLGADRIGHGNNLLADPDTFLLMRNNDYLVEIQLVSNRLLEYSPTYDHHHFPVLLRTGVPVCLNTDDRGMWDSNFTDEYFVAIREFNLSWEETKALGRASIAHSFLDEETRQALLADYEARIAAFEATYLTPDWKERLGAVTPIVSQYGKKTYGLEAPVTQGAYLP